MGSHLLGLLAPPRTLLGPLAWGWDKDLGLQPGLLEHSTQSPQGRDSPSLGRPLFPCHRQVLLKGQKETSRRLLATAQRSQLPESQHQPGPGPLPRVVNTVNTVGPCAQWAPVLGLGSSKPFPRRGCPPGNGRAADTPAAVGHTHLRTCRTGTRDTNRGTTAVSRREEPGEGSASRGSGRPAPQPHTEQRAV